MSTEWSEAEWVLNLNPSLNPKPRSTLQSLHLDGIIRATRSEYTGMKAERVDGTAVALECCESLTRARVPYHDQLVRSTFRKGGEGSVVE